MERVVARSGGDNSAVYEVRCRRPVGGVIVKLYPEHLRFKLKKEVYVYGLLRRRDAGLPTPRVLLADDSQRILAATTSS